MERLAGLGRVAIVDRGERARRVVRAVRELSRAGRAGVAVAIHAADDRLARYAREADESVERSGSLEDALRAARADSAWLGAAAPAERAHFAEVCAQLGILHLGAAADVLRRLAERDATTRLAAELGVDAAPPVPAGDQHLVEVVVGRDARGTARALGVGDASLRRGELVVLAESPSPALTTAGDGLARDLAVRAAAAAGWVGVCSVQLVVDPRTRRWGLAGLEAFAHSAPAIEALAGVDLVRLVMTLARGAPLDHADGTTHGHAFVARIEAADPQARDAGAPGRVELLRLPSGLGVRSEAALAQGDDAAADGVIATVVTRGETRLEALARLEQALTDADVLLRGSASSKPWLLGLCARPEIQGGDAPLGLLPRLVASGEALARPWPEAALLAASVEAYEAQLDLERARFIAEARRGRPRVGPSAGRSIELRYRDHLHRADVLQIGPRDYRVGSPGSPVVDLHVTRVGPLERRMGWGPHRCRVLTAADGLRLLIEVDGVGHTVAREPSGVVASPMPAVVVAIPVEIGQRVMAGEPVARIESMKVEVEVKAPADGVVREVLAAVNGQVDAGGPLVRLQPLEAGPGQAEPLPFEAGGGPSPAGGRAGYLEVLAQVRRLLLGFDVAQAEARRLARNWREVAAAVPPDDPEAVAAEDGALVVFADLQALFSRTRPADPSPERRPPLEDLWRYLHEPEQRGEGLAPGFVAMLRRALAHYAVSLDAPGRALELALLRIQKARQRAQEQVPLLVSILERRLAAAGAPPARAASREVLEELAALGRELFPPLADLAREVRYRDYDQPALDRSKREAYARAEADLAALASAPPAEREAILERLVAVPHPLATLLLARMASAPAALRPWLVEALLRRYYRVRPLAPAQAVDLDGVPCASAEYERAEERFLAVAVFSLAAEAERAARTLARRAADVPAGRELVGEVYLWQEGPPAEPDAVSERMRAALAAASFPRPVRRVSIALAVAGRGLEREASQQHFVFRGGPEGWTEDRRFRGVHFMLFERMQLGRLARFDLERLPSSEDVYLFRGVAQGNPKDERLFAMAEVRDATPVRDGRGQVVGLPELERTLHEALAGMRLFQARRPPNQRLEWNRVVLTVRPPLLLRREEVQRIAERLAPATEGLGLEMMLVDARLPDPAGGELRETLLRVLQTGDAVSVRWDEPTDRPLEPMAELQQRVVQLRRRGLTHPFELVRLLAPPADAPGGMPPGEFVEHDLDDAGALVPVARPPGGNSANIVAGVVTSRTARHPEGLRRVVLLGDPGKEMGSVAEPECRRILAAIDLAERLGVPLEWFEVCAGAKISMTTGTENMDWVSRVLRRIIEFTQRGGEINVVVTGITVGAQPYWNAEATMLMHTRGILVMAPGASMVLTGKQALEYSGSVSAEDNEGIGGYDRIMGPNGQAQYRAASVAEAVQILMRHYQHCYVAPGERFPRRAPTSDPRERDVRAYPHGPEGGGGFETVGDVFSHEKNPDRKKPFEIRRVMAAVADQDHPPLERWRDLRGGETGVVWDAHLGGWPVCLLGIQSRPLPRLEFVPADGPEFWSAGTLFPQSSKKLARAINAASGNRPLVVLANLSGFDGSPESMRRLQLEYGAEIGRAVVNFRGPIVFCVVSRYHGGAFVVFAKTLNENLEAAAVEGARASVIGGAPAAAVVFAREVEGRTRKDPRVVEAERAAAGGGAARLRLADVIATVRSEKLGEVGEEFDRIHSVERARQVGSLDRIIAPAELRPYLIDAVERGMARAAGAAAPG